MTPTQFKEARPSLGLTQSQIAVMFGRKLRQVQNWESVAVDDLAANYMRAIIIGGYRPADWPNTPTA